MPNERTTANSINRLKLDPLTKNSLHRLQEMCKLHGHELLIHTYQSAQPDFQLSYGEVTSKRYQVTDRHLVMMLELLQYFGETMGRDGASTGS